MLPKGLLKEYSHVLSLLIRLMDMAVVFCAGWVAYYFKFVSWELSPEYLAGLFVGVMAPPAVFSFFNIYTFVNLAPHSLSYCLPVYFCWFEVNTYFACMLNLADNICWMYQNL